MGLKYPKQSLQRTEYSDFLISKLTGKLQLPRLCGPGIETDMWIN